MSISRYYRHLVSYTLVALHMRARISCTLFVISVPFQSKSNLSINFNKIFKYKML
jgi:hypothetical protein